MKIKAQSKDWAFFIDIDSFNVMSRKIISRRTERHKPEKIKRTLTLDGYYEKRNKILIIRAVGGLGDIFMHRMIFEDIKKLIPDAEIHFACPKQYHSAIIDHPFIDRIIDSQNIDKKDYMISYNTTVSCGRAEMRLAPHSAPNRSDIWAEHCGYELTNHNMHIHISDLEKIEGKELLEDKRDRKGKIVVMCPVSAMHVKNLLDHQIEGTIQGLYDRGYCVVGLHNNSIPYFEKNNIPQINDTSIRQWMSVLNQADYVISVDTAAFHCSGGMGKPLVGIFTFADGIQYGLHYDFFLVQRHRSTDPTWTCGPCYNWGACPKSKESIKPCLTEITSEMILEQADNMFNNVL